MSVGTIFHLTERRLWDDACRTGRYEGSTKGLTLAEVGFIHCSFRDQVDTVANLLYGDDRADVVVLTIDSARVDVPIRVENLDGGEELFPHIYGPLEVDAVTDVIALTDLT